MKKRSDIISICFLNLMTCVSFIGCSSNNNAGLIYGEEEALIKIINYTSFQCPDCSVMHDRLHEVIKKYIENGIVKYCEKPIDIARFQYDEMIYTHMSNDQVSDFDKLLEIYSTQDQWREFDNKSDVIEFLKLSDNKNKKNIRDLKVITNEKNNIELKEVPTMFINGEKIDIDITVEEFENKIQEVLKNNGIK